MLKWNNIVSYKQSSYYVHLVSLLFQDRPKVSLQNSFTSYSDKISSQHSVCVKYLLTHDFC